MLEPLLTATDVAQLLQVHVETVYLLITKQGLPASKVGGQWRFEEDKIHAWLEAPHTASAVGKSEARPSDGDEKDFLQDC